MTKVFLKNLFLYVLTHTLLLNMHAFPLQYKNFFAKVEKVKMKHRWMEMYPVITYTCKLT